MFAGLAIYSAATIGASAHIGAKRHSLALFLALVLLAWCGAALVMDYFLIASNSYSDTISNWRQFLNTFASVAPLALVPAAFTLASVAGKVGIRKIPILAVVGSIVALPCTVVSALYSSCYIAQDCL